ncbi:hypothetical protein JCM10908_006957 [Rhodotorula pacifica]|uniref:DHHC family palmitoyltransferase n=1 Tax=Rhodotorula pacifica TaxID=1495444 RepID=UPI003182723D
MAPPLGQSSKARPLLSFTSQDLPTTPHLSAARRPSEPQPRPRSTLVKFIYLLPLGFIFSLLAFAAYTFLYTLCYQYLFLARQRTFKSLLYALIFTFLDFSCSGHFWMAYWRGTAGFVPGSVAEGDEGDEEATMGLRGGRESASSQLARFAAGSSLLRSVDERTETEEEEEDLEAAAAEATLEQQENAALLSSTSSTTKGDSQKPSQQRASGATRGALQVKSDGSARFCRKCNIPKPDRAHHCSACRRCVLKMDHHCPWLGGGCVGYANYKFFLLALLYTGVLGLWTAGIMFHELANYVYEVEDGFGSAPVLWAIVGLLGCIFGISVGSFGLYHLYLACKNRTTIEAMEHPTAIAPPPPPHPHPSAYSHAQPRTRRLHPNDLTYKQRQRLSAAAKRYNIYDLGSWRKNLKEVFGGRERWTEWVMPWGKPPGDGLSFPVNPQNIENLRLAIEAVYAEAEVALLAREEQQHQARRRERDGNHTSWSNTTFDESDSLPSDEDGPLRRA